MKDFLRKALFFSSCDFLYLLARERYDKCVNQPFVMSLKVHGNIPYVEGQTNHQLKRGENLQQKAKNKGLIDAVF